MVSFLLNGLDDDQVWKASIKNVYKRKILDGSPGLVVMGWGSCSKGHGFESLRQGRYGHFSYKFVVKNVLFVWNRQSINWKVPRDGHVFKKASFSEKSLWKFQRTRRNIAKFEDSTRVLFNKQQASKEAKKHSRATKFIFPTWSNS